jgi:hypothetical protein
MRPVDHRLSRGSLYGERGEEKDRNDCFHLVQFVGLPQIYAFSLFLDTLKTNVGHIFLEK